MDERILVRNNMYRLLSGMGASALVTVIGVLLAYQGWNSRWMVLDHVNFIGGADMLLSRGILPDRGDVSSYAAYATPGTAWLFIPGMLVFSDPRWFDIIGSSLLHFGTLCGIFFLARTCFGSTCAWLSILGYGLSRAGIFYAGSLWSIGNPFFYVWTAYFCFRWVQQRDSRYAAAGIVVWAAGMYVDMVIAPVAFIFPALWLMYRPKLKFASLAVAAAAVLAIWYPYLRFQQSRNFADLKSVVQRHKLSISNYKDSWCDPTLLLKKLSSPNESAEQASVESREIPPEPLSSSSSGSGNLNSRIRRATNIAIDGVTYNFDQMTRFRWAALPLFLITLLPLGFILLRTPGLNRPINAGGSWIPWLAWLSVGAGVVFNEFMISRFLSFDSSLETHTVWRIRAIQAVLLAAGAVLLWRKEQIAGRLRQAARLQPAGPSQSPGVQTLFAVCLLAPWIGLLLVVEWARPERYWWLWPFQAAALAAAVTFLPDQLKWRRSAKLAAQAGLTVLLLTHSWLWAPIQGWATNGWSGPRAPIIEALDYIASEVRAEGRASVSVGYQTVFWGFVPRFNFVDSRYKVGAQSDLFLKYRYEIANTSQCAEGFSADDEYRIVEARRTVSPPQDYPGPGPDEYFDVLPDSRFRLLQEFGQYQVFERTDTPRN